jgi:hypothetical protein
VIESFEKLREEMKPVLEVLIRERRERDGARGPERSEMFLPLGVPQFKLQQWGAGYALGGLQVVGLALNVAGWAVSASLLYPTDENAPYRERGLLAMYGGLATFLIAYGASVIIGNVLLE